MTVANIRITQIKLKRGNTTVSNTYTGPRSELTHDTGPVGTGPHTVRIHDGITPGGTILATNAQIWSLSNTISSITGIDSSLLANAATQQTQINNLSTDISSLYANAATQQTQINNLSTDISSLYANAASQQTQLNDLVTVGNSAPSTANETFWFNDDDGRLYIRQGNVWTDANPTVLPSPAYIFSTLENTAGNIVPDANNIYSLGSETAQWKDLWVSNATIYFNSVPLSTDVTGNITYNGNPLVSFVDGNLSVGGTVVSGGGGGTANIGNVTFDDTTIIGANDSISFQPNVAQPWLTWGIQNNVFGANTSALIAPASDDQHQGEIIFPGANGAGFGALAWAGNIGLPFDNSLLVAGLLGNVVIGTQDGVTGYYWKFGTDGNLVVPGSITYANGASILSDYATISSTLNTSTTSQSTNDFVSGNYYNADTLSVEYTAYTGASTLNFSIGAQKPLDGNIGINVAAISTPLIQSLDGTLTIPVNITGANVISASTFVSNSFHVVTAGNLSITSQYGLGTTGTILEDNGTLELIAKGGGAVVAGWDSTYGNGLGNIATINFNEVGGEGIVLRTGNRAATEYNWNFDNTGGLTFPTGGNVTFDSSAVSTIDGVTNINAVGTVGANVIQVLSDLTSFGASPAPRIYGFSSIATTGSAVNEGNISASGNLVAGRNAYVTGNVFATNVSVSGNLTVDNTLVNRVYLLEAYASETYTLPGSFTEDVCRYSYISNTVNVPSAWFNTSTYTFTPLKAGYWEITAAYDVYRNAESSMAIKKNTTIVASAGSFNSVAQQVTKIIYLNGSTDYIQIYNYGGAALSRSQYETRSWFQARWVGA